MKSTTTLWHLLNGHNVVIPLIQRDYAQGRKGKEYIRRVFLDQIKVHLEGEKRLTLDFVYGNMENGAFQPLDGQQRVTTLWLLHWYLAYRAGKLADVKDTLKKFTYQTRLSSRTFCEELCERMAVVRPEEVKQPLREYIQGQTWFFSEWMQDPTIDAMLRTLGGDDTPPAPGTDNPDNIEAIFGTVDCREFWNRLIDEQKPIITFELMIIGSDKLPIADDLYIKMNARGKKLTDFENFKADWVAHMQAASEFSAPCPDDGFKPLNQYYPEQIDNKWTDVFWNSDKQGTEVNGNIDDVFYLFLNRFVLNQICLNRDFQPSHYDSSNKYAANADLQKIIEIRSKFNKLYGVGLGVKKGTNDDSLIAYEGFDLYREYLTVDTLETLDKILQELSNQESVKKISSVRISDFDGEDDAESEGSGRASEAFAFIPQRASDGKVKATKQKDRIYFHALCIFLANPVWDKFDSWIRVVKNLVENAAVDDIESMITCLRLIDEIGTFLSERKWEVYEYLKDFEPKSISADSRLKSQWIEEKEKARQICADPNIVNDIKDAEAYCFFNGTIRFLYTDRSGNVNWDDFLGKLKNAKRRFDNKNVVSSETVKLFLSMFKSFEDLGSDSYYFTTKGYQSRGKCWKTTILCNHELVARVHDFLQESPCSRAEGLYAEFIDSGAVEAICNQSDSDKYRYHSSRSWTVHRDYSQTAGLYVYDGRLEKNKIITELHNEGILALSQANTSYGRFLWGIEVWFTCNGNEYSWTVDWSGKDIIQRKDALRRLEWTEQDSEWLSAWLQEL